MSNVDLVADAREWLATQGDLVQTHSENCHRWHPACLVSRLLAAHDDGGCTRRTGEWDMRPDPDACRDPDLLAAEVRRLRSVIDSGGATLTDDEREAVTLEIEESDRHAALWEEGQGENDDTARFFRERAKMWRAMLARLG